MKAKIDSLQAKLKKHQERQAELRGELARIESELNDLGIDETVDADQFLETLEAELKNMKEVYNKLINEVEELLYEYESQ